MSAKVPPDEVLDDLCCRFILNVPKEELSSFERLCFQIEQAHWFYEDFFRDRNNALPTYPKLRDFAAVIFQHCSLLQPYADQSAAIINKFLKYKHSVPTCGAIILNENCSKCVLVKGWHGGSWGFPKGKINKEEEPRVCAAREVFEETSFDIAPRLKPDDYLERQRGEQNTRLYVIVGVPVKNTKFAARTRKEIRAIEWHNIRDIPTGPNAPNAAKFSAIIPFVKQLKAWLRERSIGVWKKKKSGEAPSPALLPQSPAASAGLLATYPSPLYGGGGGSGGVFMAQPGFAGGGSAAAPDQYHQYLLPAASVGGAGVGAGGMYGAATATPAAATLALKDLLGVGSAGAGNSPTWLRPSTEANGGPSSTDALKSLLGVGGAGGVSAVSASESASESAAAAAIRASDAAGKDASSQLKSLLGVGGGGGGSGVAEVPSPAGQAFLHFRFDVDDLMRGFERTT